MDELIELYLTARQVAGEQCDPRSDDEEIEQRADRIAEYVLDRAGRGRIVDVTVVREDEKLVPGEDFRDKAADTVFIPRLEDVSSTRVEYVTADQVAEAVSRYKQENPFNDFDEWMNDD